MAKAKEQRKAGIPTKRRGQETGRGDNPDQNRQAMKDTPAISGRRKDANTMIADKSSQHVGGDPVTPSHNSPSTPAMTSSKRKGESGGEKVFKKRLAKKRAGQ